MHCEDCEEKLTEDEIQGHKLFEKVAKEWGIKEPTKLCTDCLEERHNAQFEEL